uniref:Uncharacterized protein n=1 Tax=Arundo donax TaxID=35708 RepID=A0A0A9C4W7_ARUDO
MKHVSYALCYYKPHLMKHPVS